MCCASSNYLFPFMCFFVACQACLSHCVCVGCLFGCLLFCLFCCCCCDAMLGLMCLCCIVLWILYLLFVFVLFVFAACQIWLFECVFVCWLLECCFLFFVMFVCFVVAAVILFMIDVFVLYCFVVRIIAFFCVCFVLRVKIDGFGCVLLYVFVWLFLSCYACPFDCCGDAFYV